jgi:putative ABC transport system permease protein
MYFLKRARLYVTRKWGKTITVGIILFIVSALVLTGLLIKTASQKTFEMAREKLGATVSYTTDLSSVMQNNGSGGRPTEKGTGGGFTIPDDFTSITTKEIELIASKSKYVESYTISANLSGNAVDFTYYDPSSSDEETSTDNKIGDRGGFGIDANVKIVGADTESKEASFDTKTIVEGEYFTDEEIISASKVIIIEKTIADLNNIAVGDTITIEKVNKKGPMSDSDTSSDESVEITYKVVGIYKTTNPTDLTTSGFMSSYNLSENMMYAPYTTVLSADLEGLTGDALTEAQSEIAENGYDVQNVTFTLTDPDYTDEFIEEVKAMDGIDTTYRSLSADDAAYEQMVGPIENVANTSTVLVIVVVIAGSFIIGLLSMLSIKDRKYELGVLLSLGESRLKIVLQLISEMIIVATLSFALAGVISNFTAQLTTNFLLNQELTSASEESDSVGNRDGGFPGGNMFMMDKNVISNMDVETIDTLTVSINIIDILKMFGIGIIIIVIGNVIQAMFVLRCNPKQILLER